MTPRELRGLPPELAARIAEGLKLERAGQRAAARAVYETSLYELEKIEHHAATASSGGSPRSSRGVTLEAPSCPP